MKSSTFESLGCQICRCILSGVDRFRSAKVQLKCNCVCFSILGTVHRNNYIRGSCWAWANKYSYIFMIDLQDPPRRGALSQGRCTAGFRLRLPCWGCIVLSLRVPTMPAFMEDLRASATSIHRLLILHMKTGYQRTRKGLSNTQNEGVT